MANILEVLEGIIAKAANVTIEEMRGTGREMEVVEARHAMWYVLSTHFMMSTKQLGRIYGKNHTTVIHAVRKFKETGAGEIVMKQLFERHAKVMEKVPNDISLRVESWDFHTGDKPVD